MTMKPSSSADPASKINPRTMALTALLGVIAIALVWVYWPSQKQGPEATPEVKAKAEQIANQVKKAEGNPPPEIPQQPPQGASGPSGPTNLRKGKQGS